MAVRTLKSTDVPSKPTVVDALAFPVPGAPMVMLFAAVIVPPPAKPPVSVMLPDVDSIFAFVPVMRAA